MINERPEAFAHAHHAICCAVVLVIGTPQTASALDVDPPPAKATTTASATATQPNGATVRPIAIRIEGTVSSLSAYSAGMTAGYAFHPMFALEGTLAWEEGFTHGVMGRLRIPMTPASSISLGVGGTLLWVPWTHRYHPPGVFFWLPAEVGYEYRGKGEITLLVGIGIRYFAYAKREPYDFGIYPFGLNEPVHTVHPAGRIGLGWAF